MVLDILFRKRKKKDLFVLIYLKSSISWEVENLSIANIIRRCWSNWRKKSRRNGPIWRRKKTIFIKMYELNLELFLYPPYFPDLDLSDYYPFANLKRIWLQWRGDRRNWRVFWRVGQTVLLERHGHVLWGAAMFVSL